MRKCKLHPRYKGIRKPKIRGGDCLMNGCECWSIYMNNYPDKKYPNFISGVPMSLNDWRDAGKKAAENLIKNLNSPRSRSNRDRTRFFRSRIDLDPS